MVPDDLSSLEAKLDLLIALLRIAYREPIDQERERVMADKVSSAVLAASRREWIEAGELKRLAVAKGKTSKPTVERRIAELVDLGALDRSGAGAHVRYRATTLFEL
jgi:Fic family protein